MAMAKLAKTAVIAGPRAAIFESSKFLSKKFHLLPKNHPRVAWLTDLTVSSFVGNFWSNGNAPRSLGAFGLCRPHFEAAGHLSALKARPGVFSCMQGGLGHLGVEMAVNGR